MKIDAEIANLTGLLASLSEVAYRMRCIDHKPDIDGNWLDECAERHWQRSAKAFYAALR
jgi:hypothetical protein